MENQSCDAHISPLILNYLEEIGHAAAAEENSSPLHTTQLHRGAHVNKGDYFNVKRKHGLHVRKRYYCDVKRRHYCHVVE